MSQLHPVKVLVVDDLPEKLLVYRSILEEPGVEVVTARSGQEALTRLLRDEFAVILLDVNMPAMDGFETAGLIRSRPRCAHTPIIFVTGHADEMFSLRGYSYGAVDFMLTPVVPDVLRTKVRVFVELCRLSNQVKRQAASRVADIERERVYLMDVLDRAAECVASLDINGTIRRINRAGRRLLGFKPEDEAPQVHLREFQPEAAWNVIDQVAIPTAVSEGVWFGESTLLDQSQREVPVSAVILAHHLPNGTVDRLSFLAHDISEKRRIESELERHRRHLEELVVERTAELQASHEQLRLSDRLAAIGTLAAGLGHDMGNLLLPVSMRLRTLEAIDLPEEARSDLRAIEEACEYLKRLTRGLRLFAQNPDQPGRAGEPTHLARWWEEVMPFLRNVLPRGVRLRGEIAADLPPVAIAPHVLTQAVFNLVQNAGDAMKKQPAGQVDISASVRGDHVELIVVDDGPGMPPEVLKRCLEPFFTTKTRTMSTGLGLALVHGAVKSVGGTIEIQSKIGSGTKFMLSVPIMTERGADVGAERRSDLGRVSIRDQRLCAYAQSLLRGVGVSVTVGPWNRSSSEPLLLLDDPDGQWDELSVYLAADAGRRAVVLGGEPPAHLRDRVVHVGAAPLASELRAAIQTIRPVSMGSAT